MAPIPAAATDSKKACLLQEEEVANEAPPSYSETSTTKVIGDGNVYSDLPRPGMVYSPGNVQAYTPRAERKGTWSFGFFDCFSDPGASAKACFCPCVSYGQTRHRLHSPATPAPFCSTPCMGYCLTASCMPGAESIFGLLNRNELRQRLNINQTPIEGTVRLPGQTTAAARKSPLFESLHAAAGFVDDAARHLFCGCCALVQEDREVRQWVRECEAGALETIVSDEGVQEEGARLLGAERGELRGLRG